MLQQTFFRVNVDVRINDTLLFESHTPGNYNFVVPNKYNYVVVEYAGAAGGPGSNPIYYVGRGAICKTDTIVIQNRTISGKIGQKGQVLYGGAGYSNGSNGYSDSGQNSGGGGGSTSVEINNTTYEASAGAGQSAKTGTGPLGPLVVAGGNGGGPYGKARGNTTQESVDSNQPDKIGLNSANGYVKIWGGYNPYYN